MFRLWKRFSNVNDFKAFLRKFGLEETDVMNRRAIELLTKGTPIEYSESPARGKRNPTIRWTIRWTLPGEREEEQ